MVLCAERIFLDMTETTRKKIVKWFWILLTVPIAGVAAMLCCSP